METGKRKLILGLLAHVDAGKTTLSEGLLYQSGAVRKLGRVDHRDSFLDTDVQEREKGITIFSKQAELIWKDLSITLLDTPGHVDFSSEMERTLSVLDCAVLVISGADGVQGHTQTLWKLLQQYNIPTFLFVNKMDQPGTDYDHLIEELRDKLSDGCVDLSADDGLEQAALCDEEALSEFLESGAIAEHKITEMIAQRALFPCYFGSALKMEGIDQLLDGLVRYAPHPQYKETFSAKVYKITRDPQDARLTWLKVTGGKLRVRDLLNSQNFDASIGVGWQEKVNQIRFYSGSKFQPADEAQAGCICAVTGLTQTRAGETLGDEKQENQPILVPVLTYQVQLQPDQDPHHVLQAFRKLEEEDPQLHVIWNEVLREIHVRLMGEVQLEILQRELFDRFNLRVTFGEGSIFYQETIDSVVEGVGHYEPLRHYAETHLILMPAPRGSGIHIETQCSEDFLARNWQRLILTHLYEKQHVGVLTGAPITDIRIILVSGRAHLKHTEGGDFRQATYRAVRQGLMQAKSVLLEPWYNVRLEVPSDCLGRAMNDLQQMGGSCQPPELKEQTATLIGSAPVAKIRHYAKEVVSYSHGRGHLTYAFRGYEPVPNQDEVVAAIGYDPEGDLDNSPDSIFCSHGAGYVVKWNEVQQMMHLEAELEEYKAPGVPAAKEKTGYSGTKEEDDELKAIFERTYGPIKTRNIMPTPKSTAQTVSEQVYIPPEEEYLLVDGYNIIFAWDELKQLAKTSLESARDMLLDILCNFQGVRHFHVIVVFDAYKVPSAQGHSEKYHNLDVVYTQEAQTADSYIEKATYTLGKQYRVRVATSDAAEQNIIWGNGAFRVSAKEFHREVETANGEIAKYIENNNLRIRSARPLEEAMRNALLQKEGKGEK